MTTRPELCESCAAGRHRAYCATFPRPCEDLIEIWDSAREEALEEAAALAEQHSRGWAILRSLEATYKSHEAEAISFEIRALKHGAK